MNGRINTVLLAIGVTLLTLNILGVKMPDAEAQVGGVADGPTECVPVGIAVIQNDYWSQEAVYRLWADGRVDRAVVSRDGMCFSSIACEGSVTVLDGCTGDTNWDQTVNVDDLLNVVGNWDCAP